MTTKPELQEGIFNALAEPRPACGHDGCTSLGARVFSVGPRCQDHVPTVRATAQLEIEQVVVQAPKATVACPECEHDLTVRGYLPQTGPSPQGMAVIKRLEAGDMLTGACSRCGVKVEVRKGLLTLANTLPNRAMRRATNKRGG